MNRHLKRGLLAGSIVSGLVALAGALNIYFDPSADVPAVGYYALGWLVKAVLIFSLGSGLMAFAVVGIASASIANAEKRSVQVAILCLCMIIGISCYYLSSSPNYQRLNQEKQF